MPPAKKQAPLTTRSSSLRCVSVAEHHTAEQYSKIGKTKPQKHLPMSNLTWNTRQDFLKIPSLWEAALETERRCFSRVNLEYHKLQHWHVSYHCYRSNKDFKFKLSIRQALQVIKMTGQDQQVLWPAMVTSVIHNSDPILLIHGDLNVVAVGPRVLVPQHQPDVIQNTWSAELHSDVLRAVVDGMPGEATLHVVIWGVAVQQVGFHLPCQDHCVFCCGRHVLLSNYINDNQ